MKFLRLYRACAVILLSIAFVAHVCALSGVSRVNYLPWPVLTIPTCFVLTSIAAVDYARHVRRGGRRFEFYSEAPLWCKLLVAACTGYLCLMGLTPLLEKYKQPAKGTPIISFGPNSIEYSETSVVGMELPASLTHSAHLLIFACAVVLYCTVRLRAASSNAPAGGVGPDGANSARPRV